MTTADQIQDLRTNSAQGTYEQLEAAVLDILHGLDLSELREVYTDLGFSRRLPTKKAYTDKIVQYATNARYMYERTQF